MRIAISADYVNLDNIGGAGRVVVETARALLAEGHEVAVVAGGPSEFETAVELGGNSAHWIAFHYPTDRSRGVRFMITNRRKVQKAWGKLPFPPDRVIHNQPLSAQAIGAQPVPTSYIFHSPWSMEYLANTSGGRHLARVSGYGAGAKFPVQGRTQIERSALRRVDHIVCLSESMRGNLQTVHPLLEKRAFVCPGGVDHQRFQPLSERDRAGARAQFGAPAAGLLLCAVRRMVPRTGLDNLLHALAQLGDSIGPYQLVLPGLGPMRGELMKLAEDLGLASSVHFPGYLPDEDLPRLYAASDLSIVPTRALEGFGLSTLESLVSETPVMATPVGGSVEILEQLDQRLLTEQAGSEGLARGLSFWASRRNDLATLRHKCRPFVLDNFSWNQFAQTSIAEESTETLRLSR